jgi:hypothetical protein
MINLKNNYHVLELQERIVREVILNVELLINDKSRDISEYQIQEFILQFLRRNLDKNIYEVSKESFGKHDIAISKVNSSYPLLVFELKTFVKPKEKLQTITSYKKIIKDFDKLYSSKTKYDCRSYFILACKEKDLECNMKEFGFVTKRLKNNKSWQRFDEYKIRPSRKDSCGRSYCFSWEIKK